MKYYKFTIEYTTKGYRGGEACFKDIIRELKDDYAAITEAANWHAIPGVTKVSWDEIKTGKTWKVTMDGTAHLRDKAYKLVCRDDMHKVMFVDALDMYDAEQIAYRVWERQVKEDGWNDISIWRTMVDAFDVTETKKEVA